MPLKIRLTGLLAVLILIPAADVSPQSTGLDWSGQGSVRRMLYWANPFPMYNATYFFKVYQRQQVSGVGDGSRYYTTFFWGNNGSFTWGSAYHNSYYGAHPYPIPANTGDGKWEISIRAGDPTTRDDGSAPYFVANAWYNQAYVAQNQGSGSFYNRFYIALPSVANRDRITISFNDPSHPSVPPHPAIVVGQAPDNCGPPPGLCGGSWGGYSRWEEQNAIIRGMQFFNSALTEAQILALSALETDAEVLSKCSELGIASPWYLNMNPTPTDVQDKSGNGHHPSWDGIGRPTLYSEGPPVTMTSLSVTPASSSVEELLTRQFTATAYYDNSSNSNVSAGATWSSTNTAVATVNSAGLASGKTAGSAKIIAVYGGFRDTADLTVTASTAVLESLTITGSTGFVVRGGSLALGAMAHYSNGSSQDKTASAAWGSGNNSIATVNTSGVVSGASLGQVTITAGFGGKQDTVVLNVIEQPAFVKKINFQPASTAVPSGYVMDDGSVYSSSRGHGWETAQAESRERNLNPDKRYDTFVKTYSASNWMVDIPSPGSYKITIVMGDTSYSTANTLVFGGQTLISAASSTTYSSVTDTLTVSGSRLVFSVTGAICYIDVESVAGSMGETVPGAALRIRPEPCVPNPFRTSATLGYFLDAPSAVHVRIYDQSGKIVRVLSESAGRPGRYAVTWDGRDAAGRSLSSGMYVAKIAVNNAVYTARMVLAK